MAVWDISVPSPEELYMDGVYVSFVWSDGTVGGKGHAPPLPPPAQGMSDDRKVLVAQSCPTLCDPMDCSLPGVSVHGIVQARIPEWVAISFSRRSS